MIKTPFVAVKHPREHRWGLYNNVTSLLLFIHSLGTPAGQIPISSTKCNVGQTHSQWWKNLTLPFHCETKSYSTKSGWWNYSYFIIKKKKKSVSDKKGHPKLTGLWEKMCQNNVTNIVKSWNKLSVLFV